MRYTFEAFQAEVELASKTVTGRPTWTAAAVVPSKRGFSKAARGLFLFTL